MVSKNRAHQSYLILNHGAFCNFSSQYARNIHTESVPIRKFLAADVECIKRAFPCLLGLTIRLLQTIFVSKKKAMKNEKWKAQNKFVQFVQFVVKKINVSLSAKRDSPTKKVFQVFQVFQVFHFAFGPKKTPIFGPNRNKTGVSSVSGVSSVPSVSSRKKQTPNQARSATNQASLQAANQARSATNLF